MWCPVWVLNGRSVAAHGKPDRLLAPWIILSSIVTLLLRVERGAGRKGNAPSQAQRHPDRLPVYLGFRRSA